MTVHAHMHSHNHSESSDFGAAPRVITKAIGVSTLFLIIEFIGGWIANSLALISDAAHNLTDIGAMLLSLFALWFARRPITSQMSFGYHRAEVLGALLSGLSIWAISGFLIYAAVLRLQSPPEVKGPIVFVIALFGLAANLLSMRMLHTAKEENITVRATYLHVLSDSFGNLGAIVAGAVLIFTDWRPIDPIVTLIFSVLMLASSWSLVKESIEILMESTPKHLNSQEILQSLQALPGVNEVHDLHIWAVSMGRLALSVHLISSKSEGLLNAANQLLQEKYNIRHTTIQIEHPNQFQSKRCYDCVPLEISDSR